MAIILGDCEIFVALLLHFNLTVFYISRLGLETPVMFEEINYLVDTETGYSFNFR